MSLAIVDVREWQNVLDLRTGKPRKDDTSLLRMVKNVLASHPYPGDIDIQSNRWVTDTALDLIDKYHPQFVFLSYAQQYFSMRFTQLAQAEREKMMNAVFLEVERFTQESGFLPVIVGTGDMTAITGDIDLSRLDGLAVSSHWSTRYIGLYEMSYNDLKYIKGNAGIERVVSKKEFVDLFGGSAKDAKRLPDFLAVAKEGVCFRTPALRRLVMIPACNACIPVATTLGEVNSITDISDLIAANSKKHKIALIMVEGVGINDFKLPYKPCSNGMDWYFYEAGSAQYLAISTGKHQFFTFPAGYREYVEDNEQKEYPFSGYFNAPPDNTLGNRINGRSVAVGNRSMFMHTTTGTDISIECFARNLYNQGCMAVVHRQDK
jgi:hypothetical protein